MVGPARDDPEDGPRVRREETVGRQQETVMAYADRLPLVWVDENFGETVTSWARDPAR